MDPILFFLSASILGSLALILAAADLRQLLERRRQRRPLSVTIPVPALAIPIHAPPMPNPGPYRAPAERAQYREQETLYWLDDAGRIDAGRLERRRVPERPESEGEIYVREIRRERRAYELHLDSLDAARALTGIDANELAPRLGRR